jgi:acetoacetate decarboxylase
MVADFKGYGTPHTQRGRASAYGPAPWHLSGRVFTIWYRLEDPDEARRQIAPPLEVPPNPLCRARFYELVMDAGQGDHLVSTNPEQTLFYEAVIAIECSYKQLHGDYSVHMYSDNATYISWAREVVGWPLKMGHIVITKPWKPYQLESGVTVTGVLDRFGTQLMKASVTLTEPMPEQDRPRSVPNWFTYKFIPSIEGPELDVSQLVVAGPSRMDTGLVWKATGTLELGEGLNDELHFLRPGEIVSADYVPYVDLTVGYGKVLERF